VLKEVVFFKVNDIANAIKKAIGKGVSKEELVLAFENALANGNTDTLSIVKGISTANVRGSATGGERGQGGGQAEAQYNSQAEVQVQGQEIAPGPRSNGC
jgi:hypothetical protein